MLEVSLYVLGPLATNTYLLKNGNEAILIDPASKAEKLIDILGDLQLKAILLTHGHFDHIKAVDGLYERYRCPIYLHEADEKLARDKYSGSQFGFSAYVTSPLTYLQEGALKVASFEFEVIFTPGHTPGSVIYISGDYLFSGDTLFKGSIGRTDLEGGDMRRMKDSLRIFRNLDRDYIIAPGHDEMSRLSDELLNNYYLQ